MRSVMDLQFYSNLLKDNPTKNLNSKGGVPKREKEALTDENGRHRKETRYSATKDLLERE